MSAKRGWRGANTGDGGRRARVLYAVATDHSLSTAETAVLLVLEAHVGYAERESGRSWPSVETVGRCAGMSERQARRVLSGLRVKRWITVSERTERGCQTSSAYVVTPPEPTEGESADDAPPLVM